MGYLAGVIWKQERPLGLGGDLGIGVLVTILIGLMEWYLIPALGFSNNLKNLAVAAVDIHVTNLDHKLKPGMPADVLISSLH